MSILLYNLFLWLYQISVWLVSPWNRKAASWIKGRRDLLARIASSGIGERRKKLWMHCASLGEFEQGKPVIEALRRMDPDITVLITFFSPSGYLIGKDYAGADFVFYLPADSNLHARAFLDIVNPSLVIWIKYDYWFYYLTALRKRGIPVLLVSPLFREDQPFFKWYGNLHRLMLDSFRAFFVQTDSSKRLLGTLGISQSVLVSGDTRFDRVIDIAESFEKVPGIAGYCGSANVIVAGSTWEEDEEELDHYANAHPEIRFILAPHEVEEEHLRDMEALFRPSIRYSELIKKQPENTAKADPPHVLIIDNVGMLARLYHYATICYVGGGFGEDGVHNVLEAAVYGKPVVTGPVIEKYVEVVELSECGGVIIIDNALEAESVFERLFRNEDEYAYHSKASRDYVYGRKGATAKIVEYIQENRLLTS